MAVTTIIFQVIGGLAIFLLGMKNMSEGMQAVAGSKLRKLISAVTDNRFLACGVGVLVTSIIQSSSVTTVMVVGLVNSSFMTLTQAIGVIFGANIGTTITGWILTLKIDRYGLPVLAIAAIVYLFARRDRIRYTAMTIMGIGMVFFGLQLMKEGFKPLASMPEFKEWFHRFSADDYWGVLKCAAAGCILTMIVQSSSATLGITMGAAVTGLIRFDTAAALVLGENIGTTITALLASLGATTNAKRAAYSHMVFNLIGVAWITAVFPYYMKLIIAMVGVDPGSATASAGNIRAGIALVHSGFNITNTIIFLPFLGVLAKVVTRLVPDHPHKEAPRLTFLNVRMLDTPAIGIQQSFVEVLRMAEGTTKMMSYLDECLTSAEPDEAREKKVFHREEVLDIMQKEIVEFLSSLLAGNVSRDVMTTARKHLRMADEYESVSDYVVNVLKLCRKMRAAEIETSEECKNDLLALHARVQEYLEMINTAVAQNNDQILSKARTEGDEITHMMKEARARHLDRVEQQHVSPLGSLVVTDMLTAYRKIKDHGLNIAEALAGEK